MTLTATIMDGVALARALARIEAYIRRYVVASSDQAIVATLWVAHTHAFEAADATPYLAITSAMKRAGKTRLLEVLEPIVARPWFTGRTSAAALVRKVAGDQPTLLLDESDAAFNGEPEYAEHLRGILNTGYRRSGRATLCVGQGSNQAVKEFPTFCPKAIAGIGALPGTIADRAIPIKLKRRKADELCSRWRARDGATEAAPLFDALAAWAPAAIATLRDARPALPPALSDRAQDVWEPLLAIAGLAAGEWPVRARAAALAITGAFEEDTDDLVELLRDIAAILPEVREELDLFGNPNALIPSKTLLTKLTSRLDRPWATWRHDKPMTERALRDLLKPLDIRPAHGRRGNGYHQDAFRDAIARYLPSEASQLHNANKTSPELPISNVHGPDLGEASRTADHPDKHWGCEAVKVQSEDREDERYVSF